MGDNESKERRNEAEVLVAVDSDEGCKKRIEEAQGMDSWCRYTKKLLMELGLEDYWISEKLGTAEEWFLIIRDRIHEREEKQWREEMKKKPKLRTYRKFKHTLEREPYLEIMNKRGITELVRLRGGANRLRIEKGRFVKLPLEEEYAYSATREK